jgi:peptidoglycan/LPS O-acetylase OafA/YrhL
MSKAHFDSIDLLRGLAALAVCVFHLSTHFLAPANPLRVVGQHGHLGVECFFVISGFIIPFTLTRKEYRLGDFPRFMLARILRLHPAYLGSLGLVLLCLWLPGVLPPPWHHAGHIDWTNVVRHLFYLPELTGHPWLNGVYWSLGIEMQYYLLLGLAYPLLARRQRWPGLLFCGLFAAGALVSPKAWVFHYGGLFVPGILLFWRCQGRLSRWQFLLGLAVDAALLRWVDGSFWGVGAVLLACAVILRVRWNTAFTVLLGRVSYSFYLLHTIVAFAFLDLLTPSFSNEAVRTLLVLAATGLAVAVAALYHRWIEEPTQRLGQRCFQGSGTSRRRR